MQCQRGELSSSSEEDDDQGSEGQRLSGEELEEAGPGVPEGQTKKAEVPMIRQAIPQPVEGELELINPVQRRRSKRLLQKQRAGMRRSRRVHSTGDPDQTAGGNEQLAM